jgi:hypothetical protein
VRNRLEEARPDASTLPGARGRESREERRGEQAGERRVLRTEATTGTCSRRIQVSWRHQGLEREDLKEVERSQPLQRAARARVERAREEWRLGASRSHASATRRGRSVAPATAAPAMYSSPGQTRDEANEVPGGQKSKMSGSSAASKPPNPLRRSPDADTQAMARLRIKAEVSTARSAPLEAANVRVLRRCNLPPSVLSRWP